MTELIVELLSVWWGPLTLLSLSLFTELSVCIYSITRQELHLLDSLGGDNAYRLPKCFVSAGASLKSGNSTVCPS